MGSHGFPWVPMGPQGSPWGPMGSHGVPWGPMGSPWLPWKIQECRKSSILMKTIIRFDRKLETRGPDRCAIFFRSILSRQNPLNRHMEQNIFFWPKIQFFEFSAYWTPIGPLLSGFITKWLHSFCCIAYCALAACMAHISGGLLGRQQA